MAHFPILKTGAVAQYPSSRTRRFSTRPFRFLDGSEQRYPEYAARLKRWVLRFDLLDEVEMNAIEEFWASNGGRAGVFSFTDPFDGTVYADCSFEQDGIALEYAGAGGGSTEVVIRENRT